MGYLNTLTNKLFARIAARNIDKHRARAERGNVSGQFCLGYMYYKGQGVLQNYSEAAKWYRMAAEQGDGQAQFNLGIMYAKGNGLPRDNSEAYVWFSLATFSLATTKAAKKAAAFRDSAASLLSQENLIAAQKQAASLREQIESQ